MKKLVQKQVEEYNCDYCGKECDHTPEYKLPSYDIDRFFAYNSHGQIALSGDLLITKPEQKDICPECQEKMIILLNTMMGHSIEVKEDGTVTITCG